MSDAPAVDVMAGPPQNHKAEIGVLGACMVNVEVAGVSVLYTGDYSCEEDRHLMAAEVPRDFPPNVLIVEATFGMQVHESREQRERRFTSAVERIVRRGGRIAVVYNERDEAGGDAFTRAVGDLFRAYAIDGTEALRETTRPAYLLRPGVAAT